MPSSVISSMHYDPKTLTLRIVYLSGIVYDYKNVPENIYEEMKIAGSKGRYLNYRIKGKYDFEKVD